MKEIVTLSFVKMAQMNPLDGKSNQSARNMVNKIIHPYTVGFFSDQYWEPVNQIRDALDQAGLSWSFTNNRYTHDEQGRPNGKEWTFKVEFSNNRNRGTTLWGIIKATGAGTIEEPLSRYDLVAYVS